MFIHDHWLQPSTCSGACRMSVSHLLQIIFDNGEERFYRDARYWYSNTVRLSRSGIVYRNGLVASYFRQRLVATS